MIVHTDGHTRECERRQITAERPFWGFVFAEMTGFAVIFGAYLWQFGSDRAGFAAQARHLVVWLGLLNTLVLLTGSYCVVRVVHAHRSGDPAARGWIRATLFTAAIFLVVKVIEYGIEIDGGHTLTSSTFFSYYFALTGLHLLHVAIGAVLLGMWLRVDASARSSGSQKFTEIVGGYWHMVDLLWILIFAFLYIGSHT